MASQVSLKFSGCDDTLSIVLVEQTMALIYFETSLQVAKFYIQISHKLKIANVLKNELVPQLFWQNNFCIFWFYMTFGTSSKKCIQKIFFTVFAKLRPKPWEACAVFDGSSKNISVKALQ